MQTAVRRYESRTPSRERAHSADRLRRPAKTRLLLEQLEERTLLSVCTDMSAEIENRLQQIHSKLNTLGDSTKNVLPIVNEPLAAVLKTADTLSDLKSDLKKALDIPNANDCTRDAVRSAVFKALGGSGLGILGNTDASSDGIVNENDVVFLQDDFAGQNVAIKLDLEKTFEISTFKFGLGLSGLPIQITDSSVSVAVGLKIDDWTFGFNSGAFVDTTAESLSFTVAADVSGTLSGVIGFMKFTADLPAGGDPELVLALSVDVVQSGGSLSLANPALTGAAKVAIAMTAEAGQEFPSVSATLSVDWDFGKSLTDATNPEAAPSEFGKPPVVKLENVTVGLGSVLSDMIGPIVEVVQPILEPLQPVIDAVQQPIPILTDAYEAFMGKPLTVLELVRQLNGKVIPPGYSELTALITDVLIPIADLVGQIESTSGNVLVNMGEFDLQQLAGTDLRLLSAAKDPLADPTSSVSLQPAFAGIAGNVDFTKVEQALNDLGSVGQELASALNDLKKKFLEGCPTGNGMQYGFPILDNPIGGIVSVLLGTDVDLFSLCLSAKVSSATALDPIPTSLSGLSANLAMDMNLDGVLRVGYDTRGLRQFLSDPTNPEVLLDGFWIDKGTQLIIHGGLTATAAAGYLVFKVGGQGHLTAGFSITMGPLADDDGDEKIHILSELGSCMFNVHGELSMGLSLFIQIGVEIFGEFIGWEESLDIASVTIPVFDSSCAENPFIKQLPAQLAGGKDAAGNDETTPLESIGGKKFKVVQSEGILTLNVGPNATRRNADFELSDGTKLSNTDGPESIVVTHAGENADGEIVVVSAFGVNETYYGVKRIKALGGDGSDTITIALGVTSEVWLEGGPGSDILDCKSSSKCTLLGDGDNDILRGGSGPENLLMGGLGNDELTGRSKCTAPPAPGDFCDGLDGGPGDDKLTGGPGFNLLLGGSGNDQLVPGKTHPNFMDGGPDDDEIATGFGDDFVLGGPGNDKVTWNFGNGQPLIDGGGGTDTVSFAGSTLTDQFVVSWLTDTAQLAVDLNTPLLGISRAFWLRQVERVNIDAIRGADSITVNDLSQSDARFEFVGINLGDILDPDGDQDKIVVKGSLENDQIEVRATEAFLTPCPRKPDPSIENPCLKGGIMEVEFRDLGDAPLYLVRLANITDDLKVFSYDGADAVTIRGNTGPTLVDAGTGNDAVDVIAEPVFSPNPMLEAPFMETFYIEAGPGDNSISFFLDASDQEQIFLTDSKLYTNSVGDPADAPASVGETLIELGVLYTATGDATSAGTFAGGIQLRTGAAHDNIFVLSTRPEVATHVASFGGNDRIMVSSDGTSAGQLSTIRNLLVVDGGTGANELRLVDFAATAGNTNVMANGSQIVGFAGPNDNVSVVHAATLGTMHVILDGADYDTPGERFTVQLPSQALTINGHRGGDQIHIVSTLRPISVRGGHGSDLFLARSADGTVNGIRHLVDFDGEEGSDSLLVQDSSELANTHVSLSSSAVGFDPADTLFGIGGSLHYAGLEQLTIELGTGSDTAWILGTASGTETRLTTGLGSDSIIVDSNAAAMGGDANGVRSLLRIDASDATNDVLRLRDVAETMPSTVTITDIQVGAAATDNYFGPGGRLYYENIGHLLIDLGSNGDTVLIQSTHAGTSTIVHGGDGANMFIVDSNGLDDGGTVNGIVSKLTLVGGTGLNIVALNDLEAAQSKTVTIDAVSSLDGTIGLGAGDNYFSAGGSVAYSEIQGVILGTGGTTPDTIRVRPAPTLGGTKFSILAQGPTFFDPSPHDVLLLDLMGVGQPAISVSGVATGRLDSNTHAPVTFAGAELLDSVGTEPFDLIVDMKSPAMGGNDGFDDVLMAQRSELGGEKTLEIQYVSGTVITAVESAVNSLTVLGSADSDKFIVRETEHGLPMLNGSSPAGHTNGAFVGSGKMPQNVSIHYDGGPGSSADSYAMLFVTPASAVKFPDAVATPKSGVVNVTGSFTMSYESLTPIRFDGAGGTLTFDARELPGMSQISLVDLGGGLYEADGDAGFERTTFNGFDHVLVHTPDRTTRPSSITGQFLDDRNGNGLRDPDEVGLSGWVIELVETATGRLVGRDTTRDIDFDGDRFISPLERGRYLFADLNPGTYLARALPQAGWGETMGPSRPFMLLSSDSPRQIDFGAFKLATVGGQLFDDQNGNGQRDAGEVGRDGVLVQIINTRTGLVEAETRSISEDRNGDRRIDPETESGLWFVSGKFVDTYEVRQMISSGLVQTYPTGLNHEPLPHVIVALQSGQVELGLDFGSSAKPPWVTAFFDVRSQRVTIHGTEDSDTVQVAFREPGAVQVTSVVAGRPMPVTILNSDTGQACEYEQAGCPMAADTLAVKVYLNAGHDNFTADMIVVPKVCEDARGTPGDACENNIVTIRELDVDAGNGNDILKVGLIVAAKACEDGTTEFPACENGVPETIRIKLHGGFDDDAISLVHVIQECEEVTACRTAHVRIDADGGSGFNNVHVELGQSDAVREEPRAPLQGSTVVTVNASRDSNNTVEVTVRESIETELMVSVISNELLSPIQIRGPLQGSTEESSNSFTISLPARTRGIDYFLYKAAALDGSRIDLSYAAHADYGDAPSAYPDALHVASGPFLGSSRDLELGSQPNASATGDDNSVADDEDGVDGLSTSLGLITTGLVSGEVATIEVTIAENLFPAPQNGFLDAWIDLNVDGDWDDPGEQIFSSVLLTPGVHALSFLVGVAPINVTTYARFRVSQSGGLSPGGVAFSGEVEDYLVHLNVLDFGDAPDPSYPTLHASDGAAHWLLVDAMLPNGKKGGFYLGASVDADSDGQPNNNASGDDNDANDDDDGVEFLSPLIPGEFASINVIASSDFGALSAWIDFNIDGDWNDPGEHIFDHHVLVEGLNLLGFAVPTWAKPSDLAIARFRYSPSLVPGPHGLALGGEVEDYAVPIQRLDFGDANLPFPTLLANNGARHALQTGLFLGSTVDGELDGQPSPDALGDDNLTGDDEDGVQFLTPLVAGQSAKIEVTVSAAGLLNAWIDFNDDADWADAGEQLFKDYAVAPGATTLSFVVPATAVATPSAFARFRVNSIGKVASYDGLALDGEVEDYTVAIAGVDYGDAPDGVEFGTAAYGTLLANDGARHIFVVGGLRLGMKIDSEPDGHPSFSANGDDNAFSDDEDGVQFVGTLLTSPTSDMTAVVEVFANAAGKLDAWIDFDQNSSFDPHEHLGVGGASIDVVAGSQSLPFIIPAGSASGKTFARFRISSGGGLGPTGPAVDGEVEDYEIEGILPTVSALGQVYEDTHGNGRRDSVDPGLANWTIQLDAGADGRIDATTTTDDAGNYGFRDLAPGLYEVISTGRVGSDQEWKYVSTRRIVLFLEDSIHDGLDFPVFRPGSIRGVVFHDLNGNGFREQVDGGLDNFVVRLMGRDGQGTEVRREAVSGLDQNGDGRIDPGEAGHYLFGDLSPGTYHREIIPLPGLDRIGPEPEPVDLGSGHDDFFGEAYAFPGRVTGMKFHDLNGNGVHDKGEPGLDGWTVALTGVDGLDNRVQLSQTTFTKDLNGDGTIDPETEQGLFEFVDLKPGDYLVKELGNVVLWTQTAPETVVPLESIDNFGPAGHPSFSALFFPHQGTQFDTVSLADLIIEPLGGDVALINYEWINREFHFYQEGEATARVMLSWNTSDFPFGAPLDMLGLSLETAAFWIIAQGNYDFTPIVRLYSSPTEYSWLPIEFVGQDTAYDNARGLVLLKPGPGGPADLRNITQIVLEVNALTPGLDFRITDLGFRTLQRAHWFELESGLSALDLKIGNFKPPELSGIVYLDINGNGRLDASEQVVSNLPIDLDLNSDGTIDRSVRTDAQGRYEFEQVGPGTHTIYVSVPPDTEPGTVRMYQITVQSDRDLTGLDFDLRPDLGPSVTMTGPAMAVRGQSNRFGITANDSAADEAAGFEYRIDWGDGAVQTIARTPNNGTGVTAVHSYSAERRDSSGEIVPYEVTVTAIAADGKQNMARHALAVHIAALLPDPIDPARSALFVGGSTADDRILVAPSMMGSEMLRVLVNERDVGNFRYRGTFGPPLASRIVVFGQSGNDAIVINNLTIPAEIYGDAGNDMMRGSGGDDILVGGEGNDLAIGGPGRDLLIGGMGADRLVGNADDDILIAGWTDFDPVSGSDSFDAKATATRNILAEWTSSRDYTTRVNNLRGIGTGERLNTNVFLSVDEVLADGTVIRGTIHDDRAVDLLTGNEGLDWFLFNRDGDGSFRDRATDLSASEFASDIDFINGQNP